MKNLFLILILLFNLWLCKAQDETYIQDFSHKINVKIGLDSNVYSYKINNAAANSLYELKANESVRLAASLHYKFLGLTIGFSPNFLEDNQDEALKGKSDIKLIRLRLFIKKFIQEFEYNKIEGFYVENTADFVPNWTQNQDSYLQLSDMITKSFSGKTSYVWNDKFSFKALVVQNQKQIKSAGSFIPSISYTYSEIFNPSNSILAINQENIDININGGYIHNFVFGKNNNFFASLGLSPGFGVKFSKTTQANENAVAKEKSETYSNFSLEGRLNLGYNSDKIFTGLQFNTFGVSYNESPETKVENSNVYFQLYFGYRFGAPQSIANFFDKIKI